MKIESIKKEKRRKCHVRCTTGPSRRCLGRWRSKYCTWRVAPTTMVEVHNFEVKWRQQKKTVQIKNANNSINEIVYFSNEKLFCVLSCVLAAAGVESKAFGYRGNNSIKSDGGWWMVDGEWWMVTTLIRRIYDNERDGKLNKKKCFCFRQNQWIWLILRGLEKYYCA